MAEAMVVVRPYRKDDALHCRQLVTEGTMSTVGTAYMSAVTREATFQMMILTAALLYILVGVPLTYCVLSVPIVLVLMYFGIWAGHAFKVLEMHQDMNDIPRWYQSGDDTGFWVAEMYEPRPGYIASINEREKPTLAMQEDVPHLESKYKSTIVGTVGITKRSDATSHAWLRRMAVKKEYQRRGIATYMLDAVIDFCRQKGFQAVDLVTSECHHAARETYMRRGFEVQNVYHKYVLGSSVTIAMYQLTFDLKQSDQSKDTLNISVLD